MVEADLLNNLALSQAADRSCADLVHRLVALDRLQRTINTAES